MSKILIAITFGAGLLTGLRVFGDDTPVLTSFSSWGKFNDEQKLFLYMGWTNGYLAGSMDATPTARAKPLGDFYGCLKQIDLTQAVAMIDKYYKDHPELWRQIFSRMLVEALTVPGSPCAGRAPEIQP